MANVCQYLMKIVGAELQVKELVEMLQWKGKYENCGINRVYDAHVNEEGVIKEGFYYCIVDGNCAWSVLSSMLTKGDVSNAIDEATKKLNLAVEIFSEECGLAFQEHFVIGKGTIFVNECVDWEEVYVSDYDDNELEELAKRTGKTVDELKKMAAEGNNYFEIGGFTGEDGESTFGDFKEDLIVLIS